MLAGPRYVTNLYLHFLIPLSVIFGGRDADGRLNDVHRFNTKNKTWMKGISDEGKPPSPRSFHAGTMIPESNLMVVCGGRSPDNKHYRDVHILDLGRDFFPDSKL